MTTYENNAENISDWTFHIIDPDYTGSVRIDTMELVKWS